MTDGSPTHDKLTILICESDTRFAHQAEDILKAAGHNILVATDKTSAMKRLASGRPQVVIVPSEMSQRPEARYIIDFLHGLSPRPALVLTITENQFDQAHHAWQLGVDEAVFKPLLDKSELLEAITRAVDKVAAKE